MVKSTYHVFPFNFWKIYTYLDLQMKNIIFNNNISGNMKWQLHENNNFIVNSKLSTQNGLTYILYEMDYFKINNGNYQEPW